MTNTRLSEFKERLLRLAREEKNELAPIKERYKEDRRDLRKEMRSAELDKTDVKAVRLAVRNAREHDDDPMAVQLSLTL